MVAGLRQIPLEFRNDYFRSFLLLALVPLLPEYISFFLIVGSLIFAVKDIKASGRKIQLGTLGWILAAYCLYLTITCLYSTHPFQSLLSSILWWYMLLAFVIVVNLATDKDRLDILLFCVSSVSGLVGLIAFVQNLLNVHFDIPICSIWEWLDQVVFTLVPFKLTLISFPVRAYATFPNPNMLAQYLCMTMPFAVACNYIENRPKLWLYNRACLVLSAVGIMVSYSRGGYLALIALALVLIVVNIRKNFATVLLYVAIAFLFIPETVYFRLTTLTTSGRRSIWEEAIKRVAQCPLFGYGAGTQPSAVIFQSAGLDSPHAHNIALQVLMEGGCFALLILIFAAVYCVKNGMDLMLNRKPGAFWGGFAACGFVLATFLHGMVDYPLTTPKLICCFMCLLALTERFIALYLIRRESHALVDN